MGGWGCVRASVCVCVCGAERWTSPGAGSGWLERAAAGAAWRPHWRRKRLLESPDADRPTPTVTP